MKKQDLFLWMGLVLWGFLIISFPRTARAVYPEKPVTLICVWGVGGTNDSVARTIAARMKAYFPKPVAVVNKPGGAGAIGTTEVVRATPDGYTLGSTTMTSLTIEPHRVNPPYKTPDDYTPIALVGFQAFILNVNPDVPFKTVADFIKYAKANPGKLRIGTFGEGHITHLILEQLKYLAQIDLTPVPFKGGGELVAALLGKHVEGAIAGTNDVIPHARAGKLNMLGVFDEKRRNPVMEIPTFKELGYDIAMLTYTMLIGPKNLSEGVVSTFGGAYKKVSEDREFRKFMEENGYTVQYEGSEDLKKRLWKDYRENKGIFERIGKK